MSNYLIAIAGPKFDPVILQNNRFNTVDSYLVSIIKALQQFWKKLLYCLYSQPVFIYSKSTMEHQNNAWILFIRQNDVSDFVLVSLLLTLNITHISSVSIVDCWEVHTGVVVDYGKLPFLLDDNRSFLFLETMSKVKKHPSFFQVVYLHSGGADVSLVF